ncbi:hypothetical protein [Phaeocystidibacter luteus]|uniref:Uncharacterized protein n=1 Tax=Phaeocystidibacter luteus TaxID=911197 RepID=A0A6N6RJ02_9FLAO|nr:hypothetical protein [Phaeocystidibacter luteus]KAB2805431.1 hypothetical protein F8C67_13330 [Phaeocystidibacter luteus]
MFASFSAYSAPYALYIDFASFGGCNAYLVFILDDNGTPLITTDDVILGGNWIVHCPHPGLPDPCNSVEDPQGTDTFTAELDYVTQEPIYDEENNIIGYQDVYHVRIENRITETTEEEGDIVLVTCE